MAYVQNRGIQRRLQEIEELDEEDWLTEENSDDEGIIEDSGSDSEDREDDDPIQEFPAEEIRNRRDRGIRTL